MNWNGLTDQQIADCNQRLLPLRRERVKTRCPDGHDFGRFPDGRCRRCSYYRCELEAWGLMTDTNGSSSDPADTNPQRQ